MKTRGLKDVWDISPEQLSAVRDAASRLAAHESSEGFQTLESRLHLHRSTERCQILSLSSNMEGGDDLLHVCPSAVASAGRPSPQSTWRGSGEVLSTEEALPCSQRNL